MADGSPYHYRALDDVIHSRIRLAVMAILASVDEAEFTYLRNKVGTTDGNLSTHLGRLVEAKYVEVTKSVVDGRATSRYQLTIPGRRAFQGYLDHLEKLLKGVQE